MQSGTETKIAVVLDRRIPLQSLIVNRLQHLPDSRRDEWLRNLLVLGFRAECHSIRAQKYAPAQPRTARPSVTPHTGWRMHTQVNGPVQQGASGALDDPATHTPAVRVEQPSKPFFELRKVIG